MCGIFGYLRLNRGGKATCEECGEQIDCEACELPPITPQMLYEAFERIRPRGPDRSTFHEISEYDQMCYLGFQRLAIMDPTTDGDQPFTLEYKKREDPEDPEKVTAHHSIYVICNGEIYNHHELIEKYDYGDRMAGRSDCEFLPHFYAEHGIDRYADELRGEFASAILDIDRVKREVTIHLVRDSSSIRPLFIGMDSRGFGFCSEMKGLTSITDQTQIRQIRGGRIHTIKVDIETHEVTFDEKTYYDLKKYEMEVTDEGENYTYEVLDMLERMYPELNVSERLERLNEILTMVRETFERVVIAVLESHVPLGALLSGGLDSSLVVAIAAKHLRKTGRKLRTFSIGIPGATDKEFAEAVAAEAGTIHTHVEFEQEDFIEAIPHVIKAIESYDITTVRASTGQYLISKWVRENTDIKVLLNGDYSDECNGSYRYFACSPSPITSHNETIRLLCDILYFDALRSDRGIASNGIEARTPYGHRDFIDCILEIDPRLKVPLSDNGLVEGKCPRRTEKWLLRKAFDIEYEDFDGSFRSYLPHDVLFRSKEAFSDGVSAKEKSWYEIIQESVEDTYTQDDIERWVGILADADTECVPHTKEAVHYLEIFTKHYGQAYQVIPYYWMPKWSDATDPSARVLSVYE